MKDMEQIIKETKEYLRKKRLENERKKANNLKIAS
jgi:predicted transglutaminase-like protease